MTKQQKQSSGQLDPNPASSTDAPCENASQDAIEDTSAEKRIPGAPSREHLVQKRTGRRIRAYALSDQPIGRFLKDGRANTWHSKATHRALLFVAGSFWVSMLCVPCFFGQQLDDAQNLSSSMIMYFVLISGWCWIVEIWVVVHTEQGLEFFLNAPEHLQKALRGQVQHVLVLCALLFSGLGRFDTFSDIVFTIMLFKDAAKNGDITWFTIEGVRFEIHVPLKYVSLFAVAVGVFLFQALPGLILLMRRQALPAAFKLNEFQFLLALLETEEDVEENV